MGRNPKKQPGPWRIHEISGRMPGVQILSSCPLRAIVPQNAGLREGIFILLQKIVAVRLCIFWNRDRDSVPLEVTKISAFCSLVLFPIVLQISLCISRRNWEFFHVLCRSLQGTEKYCEFQHGFTKVSRKKFSSKYTAESGRSYKNNWVIPFSSFFIIHQHFCYFFI